MSDAPLPVPGPAPAPPVAVRSRRHSVLVLLALLVLAFNLRPAASSVGPIVQEVETGLGLSAASAGLLTSLPVLAFAAFGGLAAWLAARLGVHRLTTLALVTTAAGLGWRA